MLLDFLFKLGLLNYYFILVDQEMDNQKKLSDQSYMQEIKKLVKPIYMSEIQQAVEEENQQIIQKLLFKFLRKKQAEYYCPKVLFGLRHHRREKMNQKIKPVQGWSKLRIVRYLEQRLDAGEVFQVISLIDQRNQDLCNTLLRDLLRFEEAEVLVPQVTSLIRKQNHENTNMPLLKKNSSTASDESNKQYQQQIIKYIRIKLSPKNSREIQSMLKQYRISEVNEKLNQFLSQNQYLFIKTKIKDAYASRSETLNPQRQDRKFQTMIISEIQKKVQIKKQNDKQNLLKDIQIEMGSQEQKNFLEIKNLLSKGKVKKAQSVLKSILGKKMTENFVKKITQYYSQKTNIPLQNAIFLKEKEDGLKFFQLQTQQILDLPQDQITNVLIVGMTGVGKSTFLNSFVNYFMEVDMEDNFRYIVSKDMFNNGTGKSSTTKVNIYGMPKQGKMKTAIRLIDIPGLGDTQGIKKDKEHIEMIRDRIKKTVPFINLIIYVFKSSETRITKEAEYVMGQVMGMFAKDVSTNILFVLTFADNEEPSILKPLKSCFATIISDIEEKNKTWYVKVNNSALFKKIKVQDEVDVTFYAMGQACLQKTANIMEQSGKVSTQLTISVMQKRNELETSIQGLHELINSSLMKQEQIRNLTELIVNSKAAIEGLEYKVRYKEQKIQLTDTDKIVTTCMNCKFTCHRNCSKSNEDKQKCMMMQKGFCKICPSKCSWQAHINDHKIIKRVFVEVQKTNEELYEKYKIQIEAKNKNEQLLLGLVSDYGTIMITAKNFCEQLKQLTEQLAKIELRKINHATVVEYIEILIKNQLNEKKQGYFGRIKEYDVIKQHEQRLQSTFKQTEIQQAKNFHELMKNRIEDLIPNKDIAKNLLKTVMDNYEKIKIAQQDIKMVRQQQLCSMQG